MQTEINEMATIDPKEMLQDTGVSNNALDKNHQTQATNINDRQL